MKKKRLAILCPYPFGQAPSQRFRFEQYLHVLEADGWDIKTYSFLNQSGWNVFYHEGLSLQKLYHLVLGFFNRWFLMTFIWRFQKVLIHREASPIGPPIFEWIIAKGYKIHVIYDFDDAIWLPNFSKQHQKIHRLKAYWKIKFNLRWASQVVAGNDYLASYALKYNQNVRVIPTSIDTNYHLKRNQKEGHKPLVLGWTGSHSTMEYLLLLIPALEKLSLQYDFEFVVISNQEPSFTIPNLRFIPWTAATEIKDLSAIDVGLMPLTDDEWARGKCGFKALQYLALGIPAIASNVGVNKNIVSHGETGFLVNHPEEWYVSLRYFFEHPDASYAMGMKGRATVEAFYSVTSLSPTYLSLFNA